MRERLGVALAALVLLAATLGACGYGPQSCPTALLSGVLDEQGDELVVIGIDGGGPPSRVKWPDGYGVRRVDGVLAVTDFFGTVKAREGDIVRLGGGFGLADVFVVCGQFDVGPDPAG